MNKRLINILGLTGLIQLLSYTAAVIFSPLDFPGYDWLSQAVSDLSAETAPSRMLWDRLSACYNVFSVVCVTCVTLFVLEHKTGSRLFRLGIYLFTLMSYISQIGYAMFPLTDSGKDITTLPEIMHIVVTAAVVLLSIASLILIIISGFGKAKQKGCAVCAAAALCMMFVGAIGQKAVPPEYFGLVERFSVFAAVGFCAVLGLFLFRGFGEESVARRR